MKKLLLMLLALILTLSVFGCDEKKSSKDDKDDDENVSESSEAPESSDDAQTDKYPEATKLIKEGKYEEAYKLLYAARDDEEAKNRLDDFLWVAKKQNYTDSYNESESNFVLDGKGNVLTQTTSYSGTGVEILTYTYDEKGRVIRESLVGSGYRDYVETKEYDEYDNVIRRTLSDEGFEVVEVAIVENERISKVFYSVNSETYEEHYSYDEYGYLSGVDRVENGVKKRYYTYVHAENGNLLKYIWHDDYQNIDFITEHTYDESGLLIKTEDYDTGNSGENDYTLYVYDEEDRLIQKSEKPRYGSLRIIDYTYDELGRLVKELQSPEKNDGYYWEQTYSDYVCFYLGE